MATPPLPDEVLRETIDAWRAYDCRAKDAAKALGVNYETFKSRLIRAKGRGFDLSEGARIVVDRAKLAPSEAQGFTGAHQRLKSHNAIALPFYR